MKYDTWDSERVNKWHDICILQVYLLLSSLKIKDFKYRIAETSQNISLISILTLQKIIED